MKKNTKFLSLLVFAPLLVGCGSNVKAPKFAKYGDEVKAAKFAENFDKKLDATKYAKEKALPSTVIESEYASEEKSDHVRNKKSLHAGSTLEEGKHVQSYDAKTFVLGQTTEEKVTETSKTVEGESASVTEGKSQYQYQHSKVEDVDNFCQVDVLNKMYVAIAPMDKATFKGYVDSYAKTECSDLLSEAIEDVISKYDSVDEKEKKNFKFYQNGDVFTVEVNIEESVKDENYTSKITSSQIVQVSFEKDKMSCKMYYHEVEEREYTKGAYYSDVFMAKGDVLKFEQEYSETSNIVEKNPELKVLSLKGYSPMF